MPMLLIIVVLPLSLRLRSTLGRYRPMLRAARRTCSHLLYRRLTYDAGVSGRCHLLGTRRRLLLGRSWVVGFVPVAVALRRVRRVIQDVGTEAKLVRSWRWVVLVEIWKLRSAQLNVLDCRSHSKELTFVLRLVLRRCQLPLQLNLRIHHGRDQSRKHPMSVHPLLVRMAHQPPRVLLQYREIDMLLDQQVFLFACRNLVFRQHCRVVVDRMDRAVYVLLDRAFAGMDVKFEINGAVDGIGEGALCSVSIWKTFW